jgi:hypothetical protein
MNRPKGILTYKTNGKCWTLYHMRTQHYWFAKVKGNKNHSKPVEYPLYVSGDVTRETFNELLLALDEVVVDK